MRHAGKLDDAAKTVGKFLGKGDDVADAAKAADKAEDAAKAADRVETHHLLPQEPGLKVKFEAVGLNIEDYTMPMNVGPHRLRPQGLHTGSSNWNKQWKAFFKEHQKFDQADVLRQLDKMMTEFDIPRE